MKEFIAMFRNRWGYKEKTLKYLLVKTNYNGVSQGRTIDDSLVCYSFNSRGELDKFIDEHVSKSDKSKLEIYKQLKK